MVQKGAGRHYRSNAARTVAYEWVDWGEGNDRSYSTLIPVQTQDQLEALKQTDIFALMRYYPRLHLDGGTPVWNGKG
jgi:hypothetical protein